MKHIHLFLILTIVFLSATANAQKNEVLTFKVNSVGTAQLLADNINISIELGVQNTDPQKAFDEHKLQEQKIIKLIKKYKISDKDISYTLFQISKYRDFRDKKVSFKTNQNIRFKLKDFSKYITLQIDLLKKGFYQFNSLFTSSKMELGHEKSVEDALKNARKEAELYAKNLNMNVGRIIKIGSQNTGVIPRERLYLKSDIVSNNGLLNIPQMITVKTNIEVVFNLVK